MRIANNIAAVNAIRNLGVTNTGLGKSLEKLSSGVRINRAGDDAAGLQISEGLRSEIRGSIQAQRNAQDGISFIQTAEGGLNEMHDILQRMRELVVSAANSTSDAQAEFAEIQMLGAEFQDFGLRTTFDGIPIYQDWSANPFTIQVSAQGSNGAADYIEISENLILGLTIAASLGGVDLSPNGIFLALNDKAGIRGILPQLDQVISNVSAGRARLGAIQNRLEHVVINLGVTIENLTASESRIRDTDMAAEMTRFTKSQILSQAGTSMLAQANAVPQNILTLLR